MAQNQEPKDIKKKRIMARVAVLTFPMKGKNGVTITCNMVEELNVPLDRINERVDDLRRKGF